MAACGVDTSSRACCGAMYRAIFREHLLRCKKVPPAAVCQAILRLKRHARCILLQSWLCAQGQILAVDQDHRHESGVARSVLMRALPSDDCLSWGRVHRFRHYVVKPTGREALTGILEANRDRPLLGYGLGRSYGDSCLNQDGVLIQMSGLNRILSFDSETGDLTCEAGVTIAQILTRFAKPSSDGSAWFPPVSPGTRFVTVGCDRQ
jgi:FAD/FMN-containing dehydrogenase